MKKSLLCPSTNLSLAIMVTLKIEAQWNRINWIKGALMENLVRLSKADNDPRIPVRKSTLYKWKHLKKFPRLFVKISGACFVDLNELAKIAEAGRQR